MSLKQARNIQQQIYQFIVTFLREHHRPPTNREIGVALNINSTGHISHHLKELEKKGLIEREARKSRGIKLTNAQIGIPIKGTIAAGVPLDIFPDLLGVLSLDPALAKEDAFALIVQGQSMIDDSICDGDYVIIQSQSMCQNGDIVVATHLHGGVGGSATLKRFFQEPERVRLQPANATMAPILIPSEVWDREWRIQGRVLAVLRSYSLEMQVSSKEREIYRP
jgi:repressor LexA